MLFTKNLGDIFLKCTNEVRLSTPPQQASHWLVRQSPGTSKSSLKGQHEPAATHPLQTKLDASLSHGYPSKPAKGTNATNSKERLTAKRYPCCEGPQPTETRRDSACHTQDEYPVRANNPKSGSLNSFSGAARPGQLRRLPSEGLMELRSHQPQDGDGDQGLEHVLGLKGFPFRPHRGMILACHFRPKTKGLRVVPPNTP